MLVNCPDWSAKATPAEEILISAGVVRVYNSTIKHARNSLPDHGTLKTWHKMLFEKVVPLEYYAGNFRGIDSRRPCLIGDVEVDGNTGAPFQDVPSLMQQFAQDLRSNAFQLENHLLSESRPYFRTMVKVILVANTMAKFIQIHPFRDGNGRIARLLTNHLAYRYELPMPFRHPSQRPLNAGYEVAGRAAMMGDPKPTLRYLLDAMSSKQRP